MRLNAIEVGQGRPLIILHGLLGSARNWGAISKVLGERRRVLALDMPNHGASPWSEAMDYPFMARILAEEIERLGQPAAVMGHSMGGKAAMTLALTRPDLVERLVVVDIAPVNYSHSFRDYVQAMRAAPLASATKRAEVEAHLAGVIADPGVRAFLMQNLDGAPGSYRWRANLAVLNAAMAEILAFPHTAPDACYAGPTLFVAGDRSDYIRPVHHPAMTRLFPASTLETVFGAGHWVHAEQTKAFLETVTPFLWA